MTESALIKKLQLKPGLRALFLNAPQGYVESLGLLPDGMAVVDGPPGTLDFVQLFVHDSTELADSRPLPWQQSSPTACCGSPIRSKAQR